MNFKELLWTGLFLLIMTVYLVIGVDQRVPVEKTIFKKIPSGQAKILLEGEFTGPETLASYGDFLYTGINNGQIIKIPSNGKSFTVLPDIPGARRPRRYFGLRIYNDILYALDASNGLYSINLINGDQREILSSFYDNGTTKYNTFDDFDIDRQSGIAYISVASQKNVLGKVYDTIKTNESSGLLLSLNLNTYEEKVLLDNLFLPNGVQITYEYDSVLVAETDRFRILRYFFRGDKRGKFEVFAYVPGQPDNVKFSTSGGYWVALAFSGNHTAFVKT